MKKPNMILHIAMLVIGTLLVSPLACQNTGQFTIEGRIDGIDNGKIILNRVQGHKEFNISEIQSGTDGSFKISLNEIPPLGQYRLRINPGTSNGILDLLLAGENIRFISHIDHLTDSIHFEKPGLNKAWYDYFRVKEQYETRLSIIDQLLTIYPKDDRFHPEIIKEFNLLQDELEHEVENIVSGYPGTLLAKYIQSDRSPRINPFLSPEEREEFIRYNYFNNVDFTDTILLHTDILPNKAFSYIMLFRNPRLDRDKQALEFIKAADNLLPLAMAQPTVYNYLLGYTISGFEQIGLEQVLTHIADNYPYDETCISDQDSGELQRRMEGYRMLAPGKMAPPIDALDINNNRFELSKVDAESVLIVFWASWCPHCTTMLPEIKKLAQQINGNAGKDEPLKLKVVSVSIDHAEKDFLDYINKSNLNDPLLQNYWVNLCDYKAWEGKVADDYYLYATPTMILLNKQHQILAKPSTLQELVKHLGA